MTIKGYRITERIHAGRKSIVYRGLSESDRNPVIIKTLNSEYPSKTELARFAYQFELIKDLTCPGIVKTIELINHENGLALIMEDIGGSDLRKILPGRLVELKTLLSLFIKICESLGQIHDHNIIHKDIKPDNIIATPDLNRVKIIDFSISTKLTQVKQGILNPDTLEGTLAYISPEQTGRMNRSIDYRTDLYSLGIMFYEMMTGELPFKADDTLGLVHLHIAQNPVPPHKITPGLPAVLSDIIMKLLSKEADNRYKSAFGLKFDLESCLDQLTRNGRIDDFKVARNDFSDKFQIPERIYGRNREIGLIINSLRTDSSFKREMLLVSGYAGIGKSAVVKEIHKSLVELNGYFIEGKYEQFYKNVPYSAIIQAFQRLIHQLLTESDSRLAEWKKLLIEALGPNAQIIINVIPNLELITGSQPPVPEVGSMESQNRFHMYLQKFIHVFTRITHPLVLFLDDLQWVDQASLNLIHSMLCDPDTEYLLVICTFRDNEADATHPFSLMLNELRKGTAAINHITLDRLQLPDILEFVMDTFDCGRDRAFPLAELVNGKTQGNPFFMIEFLKALHHQEMIRYERTQADGPAPGWRWETGRIISMNVTDNVVTLLTDKLGKLSPDALETIKLGACIGNRFDLKTLAYILEKSEQETLSVLIPVIAEGYLFSLEDQIHFGHDRILEAAYSLITDGEKKRIHLKIGRLALERTPKEEMAQYIFYIVNQLNNASDLIPDRAERTELARLNLTAGTKAKESAAYLQAMNYFQIGIKLLPDDHWESEYGLALSLHTECAESSHLLGDYVKVETYLNEIFIHARSLADKVKAFEVEMQKYMAQNDLSGAIESGKRALRFFGIRFPARPGLIHIMIGLIRVSLTLAGRKQTSLAELPVMKDELKLGAMRILSGVGSDSYWGQPDLLPLIICRLVETAVKYGNFPQAAYSYCGFGLILCSIGDIESGYRFGQLGLALLERINARDQTARTWFLMNAFIRHWKEPLARSIAPLMEGFQKGVECGELEFAGHSLLTACAYRFYTGEELEGLNLDLSGLCKVMEKLGQKPQLHFIKSLHQAVKNFAEPTPEPWKLKGDAYDEDVMIPIHLKGYDKTTIANVYVFKCMFCFLMEKNDLGILNLPEAEKYLIALRGSHGYSQFYFYDSLIRLGLHKSYGPVGKRMVLGRVARNQKTIGKWMAANPANQANKYWLVEAERMRVLGQSRKAYECYNRSIQFARENNFIQEEALAHECAARFWLADNQETYARAHIRAAYDCYSRWGSATMTARLKDKYGSFPAFSGRTEPERADKDSFSAARTSSSSSGSAIDINSVIKASQALSGEIVFKNLLTKMMEIAIENAGAERGLLILNRNGTFTLEAEGHLGQDRANVLQSIHIDDYQGVSLTIVQYTQRLKENVVLNNAQTDARFEKDAYLKRNNIKSVLCSPIIHQGKLIAILYLENNLATFAFAKKQLEMVRYLSSQIAISIENAMLYENLEHTVNERTKELRVAIAKLEHLASTDQLTGTYNRRRFMEIFNERVAGLKGGGSPLSLILFDIDYFKKVNDRFGHNIGDTIIAAISTLAQDQLRATDSLVRWGGEEFIILMPDCGLSDCERAANLVRAKIAEHVFDEIGTVTISAGVSEYRPFEPLNALVHRADAGLYQAKKRGRNRVERGTE